MILRGVLLYRMIPQETVLLRWMREMGHCRYEPENRKYKSRIRAE